MSVRYGDVFARDGSYVRGPAPTGLVTYTVEHVGEELQVRAPQAPQPRGEGLGAGQPELDTSSCFGDEQVEHDALVLHDWPPDPSRVRTPEAAAAHPDAGRWVLVEGYLVYGQVRPAVMCAEPVADGPPSCPAGAPVVSDPAPSGLAGQVFVEHGLFRVRPQTEGFGHLTHIATRLADVEEHDAND